MRTLNEWRLPGVEPRLAQSPQGEPRADQYIQAGDYLTTRAGTRQIIYDGLAQETLRQAQRCYSVARRKSGQKNPQRES